MATKTKTTTTTTMPNSDFKSVKDAVGAILGDEEVRALEERGRLRRVVKALTVLRANKGVTQQDVAEAMNCNQSKVSKLENGFDATLKLSDIEAYARTLDCDVTLLFSERGTSLANQIKHHAFMIRRAFLALADLAQEDPVIAKGVADLHVQAFLNINRFLQETCEKLPVSPENGLPYIHIAKCELNLDDGESQEAEQIATKKDATEAASAA